MTTHHTETMKKMDQMFTDMRKFIWLLFEKNQKKREAILLMTKDDTEDNYIDLESIKDIKMNLNDDTESIGEKSNLSNDWITLSDWTCKTESADTISMNLKQHNMNKIGIVIAQRLEEQE